MDTSHGSENNEVRSVSSTLFSLPDVLTDVGISNEGQQSGEVLRALSTVDESSRTRHSEPASEEANSQSNFPSNTNDIDTQILEPDRCPSQCESVQTAEATAPVQCDEHQNADVLNQQHISVLELDLDRTDDNTERSCSPDENEASFEGVGDKFTCKEEAQEYVMPQYTFACEPQLITGVWEEFKKKPEECFTKGCKWSPDGTCILTNSEDNLLRIFDLPRELHCQEFWPEGKTLPEMKPTLLIKEGGRVYDYCWYPFMSSWNPLSCCLVSTSQFSPVHLWDAYTGQLRATYRSYNHMDEIEHAYCVAFNLTGDKLYCGFKKRLSVFDTASPGRHCESRSLTGLGRPVGIVSCICVNPANKNIYAFSSYSQTIGLCTEPDGRVMCLMCNEGGGLTHVMFSPDGTRLYAGSRNDSQLFCWDMRNLGHVLFTSERTNSTNQRIYFDLSPDGRFLVSGSTDGLVHIWDTQEPPEQTSEVPFLPVKTMFRAHSDCVNGLSLHKQYPIMATSSGQRHPYCPDCESDEEGPPLKKKRHVQREDNVKLWWLGRNASPSNKLQS